MTTRFLPSNPTFLHNSSVAPGLTFESTHTLIEHAKKARKDDHKPGRDEIHALGLVIECKLSISDIWKHEWEVRADGDTLRKRNAVDL